MTGLDDRLTVWRLAAMTEDLTRGEVAAMRREAERLESEANKLTTMNVPRIVERGGLIDLFGEWADLSNGGQRHERTPKHAERQERREAAFTERAGDSS